MMKTILIPSRDKWEALCRRPELSQIDLEDVVLNILKDIKSEGDKAIFRYSEKFDGYSPDNFIVSSSEIKKSKALIPEDLKTAINVAKRNIEKFHSAQLIDEQVIDICQGVKCWRKNIAIEKVGLYIPGGSAPLFSTVLMLTVPAKIAGCKEIVICTPPDRNGMVNPLILYAALIAGATKIYKIGGAQAIAAMAYGTESVPKVYKIFGPGNQFVTKAKELIQLDGIPIDVPAGPSEVLIIADRSANPEFIAADLLSQAEHGPDSQVVLVSDNKKIIEYVRQEIEKQVQSLTRKEIALKALGNSLSILFKSVEDCIDFSNLYAPEHLIIATSDPESLAEEVTNAGSVFLGNYSCESAGDYATGTNHTLPTNGFARNFNGVSVESFVKKISFQKVNKEGIKNLGSTIKLMAEAEHLDGHKNAVNVRLKSLKNG